jgi:hypothetical protein
MTHSFHLCHTTLLKTVIADDGKALWVSARMFNPPYLQGFLVSVFITPLFLIHGVAKRALVFIGFHGEPSLEKIHVTKAVALDQPDLSYSPLRLAQSTHRGNF